MNPILLATTLGERIDSIFYSFDLWVFSFFGNMQSTFLTYVAKVFTTFGDENFVIPILVVGIVLCFFKKTRKIGFSLIFAIAVGTILTNVLVKPMALRVRPYNTLQDNAEYWAWYLGAGQLSESDYSFPSGHTTAAFELATSMFFCFRKSEGKKMKKLAFVFPVIALCTMGSRVYLMVHYASDVLAGLVVGVFAGIIGVVIATLICKIFEKIKFLDNIDVEKLFKKGIKANIGGVLALIAVFCVFLYAFIPSLTEGGDSAIRCAYVGEYDCQNEAKVDDDDYPAIDGENYCKIHWKQLNGVEE